MSRRSIAAILAVLPAATSHAELYIDIGAQAGTPSNAYRAGDDTLPGALFPVVWNTVPAAASAAPLVWDDGSPSHITITIAGGSAFGFDHPGTSGDDAALMDDGSQSAGTQVITLTGLDSAECGLDFVYVLGSEGAQITRVRFGYGSMPADAVELDAGGTWPGVQVPGVTHVFNEGDSYCNFAYGIDLVIEISPAPGSTLGTITGLQFSTDRFAPFSFCNASDGALASCPCASGAPESGCDTPVPAMQGGGTTGGVRLLPLRWETAPENRATMLAYGFPTGSSPAGVLMRNTGVDPSSPVVFGDGLRCVDVASSPGSFTRLGASVAAGGSSIHTFGHGGGAMGGSGTFYYQLWFRSSPASYCNPAAAFGLSNGQILFW